MGEPPDFWSPHQSYGQNGLGQAVTVSHRALRQLQPLTAATVARPPTTNGDSQQGASMPEPTRPGDPMPRPMRARHHCAKFADEGHVGVSITTVTNLVSDGCANYLHADPPVGMLTF